MNTQDYSRQKWLLTSPLPHLKIEPKALCIISVCSTMKLQPQALPWPQHFNLRKLTSIVVSHLVIT